jgi:hypothetical protein
MQSSKKRRIDDESPCSSTDSPAHLQPTFTRDEMSPNAIPYEASDRVRSESTFTYTTIHHVECSGVGRYHEHHEPNADYFDLPFLPIHSNRMTALRGQNRLTDLEGYIEDHDNISFVAYVTYDCAAHHEDIKASFERLPVPPMDPAMADQVKPYFYVLQKNAGFARSRSERLVLSKNLQDVLAVLRGAREKVLGKEERKKHELSSYLVYPYIELYHERQALIEHAKNQTPGPDQVHLTVLSDYLEKRLGSEYTEAERLFEHGKVNRKHWTKLFPPGVVVVSHKSNEPAAYVCTSCAVAYNDTLHLSCWSWAFESTFFKNEVELVVPWPSDEDTIAITDLFTYPLEYAPAGFEQELRRRGQVFWACRSRNFINYDVPLKGMEVQKVGSQDFGSMHDTTNADRPI